MKILVADALSAEAEDVFRARGMPFDVRTGLDEAALAAAIPEYAGLAVRSATRVTAPVIAAARALRVIGRAGIGIDTIDAAAATAAGIAVMNTPFGNAVTTAEHTVAMLMALARHIPQASASTHAGKWEKNRFTGVELCGKTLGIIGCGNIGALVADRAQGLKMKIIAFDPFLSADRALQLGVEAVPLDTLYARADFITLHMPLLDTTRGMIGAAALAKMKRGVRLLNIARGGLVVEDDLKAALDAGQVAGAAFDVFVTEPAHTNVLFGDPRVICTPHLGAATVEAQDACARQLAEQMCDFLQSGAVSNAVNMPAITAEEAPRLRPYITLAGQLGRMAGQIVRAPTSLTVLFGGHAAGINTKPVTAAALAALLGIRAGSVNMVNARTTAERSGIAVTEATQDTAGAYQTLLTLVLEDGQKTLRLSGTLFDGQPRLVAIDGIPLEATLDGAMLLTHNNDAPGFIGALGSVLGTAGINIGSFHLGRSAPGGTAVALVAIDTPASNAVKELVAAMPGCTGVWVLDF